MAEKTNPKSTPPPKPLTEGVNKANVKPVVQQGTQAPPPPKPPSKK